MQRSVLIHPQTILKSEARLALTLRPLGAKHETCQRVFPAVTDDRMSEWFFSGDLVNGSVTEEK